MFEPLQRVSNATRTGGQVREEDHLRKGRVVRANHLSNPRSFGFMVSASMHGMLALRSDSVLETLSSLEMSINLQRHQRLN